VRQLEAGEKTAWPPGAIADSGLPAPSTSPDAIAGLLAARDAERERVRQRDNDIGVLVSSNKALRRELQAFKVRSWRDEETIQALDAELAKTRDARNKATRRNRQMAEEAATLRSGPWHAFTGWLRSRPSPNGTNFARRPILPGDGPFFKRGFRLGGAGAIAGDTVKRLKGAPSGTLIFGPYVNLAAGTYAVTVEARLYQRLPVWANFKLDVVCDNARQLVGWRKFRLHSSARWQRFELIFTLWDGEDYPDFEMRIWAPKGTALEISRIDLDQLTGEPSPDPNGGAAAP
jgi:hypothetical protein